jgi:nitrogen fixation NifU-like protein
MDLSIRQDTLADIRFSGSGCAISQASASLLSEYVRGKSIPEVLALKPETVLGLLGVTLSPGRLKCGLLSLETLKKSLITPSDHSKSDRPKSDNLITYTL